MKSMLWVIAMLFTCGILSAAEGVAAAPSAASEKAPWTFIEICFFPGIHSDASYTEVYGVKVGAPISYGAAVYGIEGSVLQAATPEVTGLQASLISTNAQKVKGVQFSIVNLAETVSGLQLGLFNQAKSKSFQIGLLNFLDDGFLPFFPIINFKF